MHFTVLGGVDAQDPDRPVPVGGPVQRRLLGVLLVHANHSVSNDRLIEALFDGEAVDGALHALRTYVSRLRSALGAGVVETTPGGYRLVIADPEDIDTARFERMVSDASAASADGDPGRGAGARGVGSRGVAGTSLRCRSPTSPGLSPRSVASRSCGGALASNASRRGSPSAPIARLWARPSSSPAKRRSGNVPAPR